MTLLAVRLKFLHSFFSSGVSADLQFSQWHCACLVSAINPGLPASNVTGRNKLNKYCILCLRPNQQLLWWCVMWRCVCQCVSGCRRFAGARAFIRNARKCLRNVSSGDHICIVPYVGTVTFTWAAVELATVNGREMDSGRPAGRPVCCYHVTSNHK